MRERATREESQTAEQWYHLSPEGGPGSDSEDVLPGLPATGDRDTPDLSEQAGSRTTVTLTNPPRTGFSQVMRLDRCKIPNSLADNQMRATWLLSRLLGQVSEYSPVDNRPNHSLTPISGPNTG